MLDLDTLWAVQGSLAVVAFLLIFFGTYRPTRANYAGIWSLVVLGSALTTLLYIAGAGAGHSRVLAALGTGVGVSAVAFVGGAVRSLLSQNTPLWWYAIPLTVITVVGYVENPSGPMWPTGYTAAVGMATAMGAAAWMLWRLIRHRAIDDDDMLAHGYATTSLWALALSTSVISVYYVARVVTLLTVGPESTLYQHWLGPVTGNLTSTVTIVIVTYSVSELSRYEVAHGWRLRARHDDLTGLLSRTALTDSAQAVLAQGTPYGVVIMADFDHFKAINDTFGHAVGDRILKTFAHACDEVLEPGDVVGRWGGEEFVLVLPHATSGTALAVTDRLAAAVATATREGDTPATLSFGAACIVPGVPFEELLRRADAALYGAKRAGRNRTHFYAPDAGEGRAAAVSEDAPGVVAEGVSDVIAEDVPEGVPEMS